MNDLLGILYNSQIMDIGLSQPKKRTTHLKVIFIIALFLFFLGWLLNTPEGILGKADAVGYAVCHQIDLRTFHIGDRPLPLCARCSGMYLGAVVGLVFQLFACRKCAGTPSKPVIFTMILMLGAFIIDGGNSFYALIFGNGLIYQPSNMLRLFTGTGMGLVIASAIYPAFNQTVWRDWSDKPAFQNYISFFVMVSLSAVIDIMILTENSLILYPLAIISAGGVMVLLTMLYSMIYIMVAKQENRFEKLSQLTMSLLVGVGVGLLQVAAIDYVRYLFTGTWDGFHFG